jgi:hypothetical protein
MQIFDSQTFRQFLGHPTLRQNHSWGIEERYVVSEPSLIEYEDILRNTLYHHHSSFGIFKEIERLGYPQAARAMQQRNSGTPKDNATQMGNLGEVFGREFGTLLGFETTWAFPNRLNPNVDQSMKGVDIVGLRRIDQPAELLIGEAKSRRQFSSNSVADAYDHLVDLRVKQASRILRLVKESLHLQGDSRGLSNVDRHMASSIPRRYLIVLITQTRPRNPFAILTNKFSHAPLPNLMAVHVQVQNLKGKETDDGQPSEESWLSRLFAL